MKTIQETFGNIAKFFIFIAAGSMFLGIAFFLWTMADTWDARHTDSLLLWSGIIFGGSIMLVIMTFLLLAVLRFSLQQQQQQQNSEIIRDGFDPYQGSRQQQYLPVQQQYLPAPQQVGYNQSPYGQPQGYGQPMMQMPPQPPVEGSFQRSSTRYDLELD